MYKLTSFSCCSAHSVWKSHLGAFQFGFTQTPVTFHLLGLLKWMAAAVRFVPFSFPFSLLISAANIGVRATRPSPQDPPPSAPATPSTSVAAMHEARNLQDVSLLICMCLSEPVSERVRGSTCFDRLLGYMSLWGLPCVKHVMWNCSAGGISTQSSKTLKHSHTQSKTRLDGMLAASHFSLMKNDDFCFAVSVDWPFVERRKYAAFCCGSHLILLIFSSISKLFR